MFLKRFLWSLAAFALLLAAVFFALNSRAATETANYEVQEKEGNYEIRKYPRLQLARIEMRSEMKSQNSSFMKLFRYIDGANEKNEKISMTTPVFIEKGSQTKAMSFVMPEKTVQKGTPKPKGEVSLGEWPAMKVAVLRFTGVTDETKEKDQLSALRAWLAKKNQQTIGEPFFAYYDPPWTPGILRRNEVMIRLVEIP